MGSVLQLENFDQNDFLEIGHVPTVPAKPDAYNEGYADGLAAAEAQFAADQSRLTDDLIASVSANVLSQQALQQEVTVAVQPLLDAMINTLLPAALAPALHAHLADIVQTALLEDGRMPITLRVAPAQCAKVQEVLSGMDTANLQIVPDPSLSDASAWVITQTEETDGGQSHG